MRQARSDKGDVALFWDEIVRGVPPDRDDLDPDLRRTIAFLHTHDDTPSPDPMFARRLEEKLMMPSNSAVTHAGQPAAGRLLAPGWLPRWTPDRSGRSFGRLAAALALLLVAGIAAVGLFRNLESDPSGTTIPAAQVSSPATSESDATPPTGESSGLAAVPGCTAEPREPGRVEQLFSEGASAQHGLLPRDSDDVNHVPAYLDGDAYVARFTEGPADDATIAAINETLSQLDACHYYVWTSDGGTDVDGRYFANFSDDFFRLQFASPAYTGSSHEIWARWIPKPGVVPVVEQAWRTMDGRVMATVLTGREFEPDVRTVMVFSQTDGRWLVEEVARNVAFDAPPELPAQSDDQTETLEIVIYDADAPHNPGMDGNYSFLGQFAPDYPFIADGGLVIRLINLGTVPHRFSSPKLGIDQTVAPGEIVDLPIGAPAGTYDWALYEGDDLEPTATHTLVLVPPGTMRGLG